METRLCQLQVQFKNQMADILSINPIDISIFYS